MSRTPLLGVELPDAGASGVSITRGLDAFAARVVPLLQERGSLRAEYTGPTLREHLGLGPARSTRRAGGSGTDRRQVAR
jgi:hypothetical protein